MDCRASDPRRAHVQYLRQLVALWNCKTHLLEHRHIDRLIYPPRASPMPIVLLEIKNNTLQSKVLAQDSHKYLPLIKDVMPNRFTKMLSVWSELVNNSATTYSSGLTWRAASNIYSATCRGVLWQLSNRMPSNKRAVVSTYLRIKPHRKGLSSGLSPNLWSESSQMKNDG